MKPEKGSLVTAMSVQMCVEIIPYGNGQIMGKLESRYLETPYEFYDLLLMIHKMEEIFDTLRFPQAFLTLRTFKDQKRGNNGNQIEQGVRCEVMKPNIIQESEGAKCTFEITVRFRQNATWQGQIHWAEKNQKQNFRSVLEMLKLMDEALIENSGDVKPIAWLPDSDTESE